MLGDGAIRNQSIFIDFKRQKAYTVIITHERNDDMKCTKCGCLESKVIDSRSNDEGTSIRRRRECLNCKRRFTTYEVIESSPILVIKRDGTRQSFETDKLRRGLIKACEKRPVTAEKIGEMVTNVERKIYNTLLQEISSKQIGEMVMDELKDVDGVAYIRFASVYRDFRDVTTFAEFIGELERIIKEDKK